MSTPAFLPDFLESYASYSTDEEMFKALSTKPQDLVAFFKYGLEDVAWGRNHTRLFELIIRWTAKQFYLNLLTQEESEELADLIQNHLFLLQSFLFFRPSFFLTLQITAGNGSYLINTFLFGVYSPVLKKIFKRECFEKLNHQWTFLQIQASIFEFIQEYVLHGTLEKLWTQAQPEIFALMKQAHAWEIQSLTQECAIVLKRYLQPTHVIDYFIQAHKNHFEAWKEVCREFFNQQAWGIQLLPCLPEEIKLEFLDDKQETLELFQSFASIVTHLAFSRSLTGQNFYRDVMRDCPHLMGLDLSGSAGKDDPLNNLPANFVQFNLAACPWLQSDDLRQLNRHFPAINFLDLSSNGQLNYLSWGELPQFKNLKTLKLAYCYQIEDGDIQLITQGLPHLTHLNIEECRRISDQGLLNIAAHCMHLNEVNLNYCSQFSEQAIVRFITLCYSLTHIHLHKCELTDYTIKLLKKHFSKLMIIL